MLHHQKTFLYYYLDKNKLYVKRINYCRHRQKHPKIGCTSDRMDWEEATTQAKFYLNYKSGMEKMNKRAKSYITIFHREWAISKAWVRWREHVRAIFPNFTLCSPKEDECDTCFAINIELVDESIWEERKRELLLVVDIEEMRKTGETVPWFRSEKRNPKYKCW